MTSTEERIQGSSLRELVGLFSKLGLIAFGGPAAHIAMMHDEVVDKRRWFDDQRFLDLIGATNLIPGPNSTELAIHIGLSRAGIPGLIAAGVSFILPAMALVMGLAAVYQRYGATPQAEWLLWAIKPVVIAIILKAILALGQKAIKDRLTGVIAALALGLFAAGINILLIILLGGLAVMVWQNRRRITDLGIGSLLPLGSLSLGALASLPFTLSGLFLTFLKIGSVLYGSGYVLVAFLQVDFVDRLGWLTSQQLLDAVAVGQLTPGPVFTTATFIGYILGGVPGGLVATLGIFLPSFIFVALSNPFIPRLRESAWAGAFLDGVNAASLALMTAVTVQLALGSILDLWTGLIALVSLVLVLRYNTNTTWLILGAALVGLLRYAILVG
jgi:chromate transporter